jgi:hypothetical protein
MNPLGDLPSRLRPFVRDGRISAMPAKHAVRLLLLDLVAQAFEPGRRYPEPAVNEILKGLYDDHAALRRYLVDGDSCPVLPTARTGAPAAPFPSVAQSRQMLPRHPDPADELVRQPQIVIWAGSGACRMDGLPGLCIPSSRGGRHAADGSGAFLMPVPPFSPRMKGP